MSIFDEIERDAKAGTPGDWWICNYDAGDRSWWAGMPSVQASEEQDCAIVHWDGFTQQYWRSANGDKQIHANARRIARVPDLERIALAAKELADNVDFMNETGCQVAIDALMKSLTAFRVATK